LILERATGTPFAKRDRMDANDIQSPPRHEDDDRRFVLLAAIDGSNLSEPVVAAATRFASMIRGSEIHLVHVTDGPVSPERPRFEKAWSLIHEHARSISERGVRVIGHIAVGEPSREVVQVGANVDADWIFVGTHGRTGLNRVILGSVAEAVVRHAGCPVLVVRPKKHPAREVPEIEAPCAGCVKVQHETGGAKIWCARHSERHAQARLHYEYPKTFGVGSSFLRP
jgi:nucleotide-binding universal stress UspA family protein